MEKLTDREKELELLDMEERIHVFRRDLKGDALLSARLVKAARESDWAAVERLLAAGADPRICRFGDAFGVESALFYALRERKFDVAGKLYAAGDRLEDLIVESEVQGGLPESALGFLAFEMRRGRNWFFDASMPLSECCRCASFARIDEMIETAPPEELDRSVEPLFDSWLRYHRTAADAFVAFLERLRRRGARLPEAKKRELTEKLRSVANCPAAMRPAEDALDKLEALLRKF